MSALRHQANALASSANTVLDSAFPYAAAIGGIKADLIFASEEAPERTLERIKVRLAAMSPSNPAERPCD